ncbi:MAG: rRNA maturation RNase YbeY [Verrucomicrobiae bacterium]|nr:rRNA maturation RNase YbeY [Verrucomicrobiae bacterium]
MATAPDAGPWIECYEHCPQPEVSVDSLNERARAALPLCLVATGAAVTACLPSLEEVEVSLVSDETIAGVHGEFMDDPTATDVITFQHGEILVSVETAKRCAGEFGHPAEREALLYVIHGLLHLNGHDDLSEPARTLMHAEQERILEAVWPWRGSKMRG